MSQAGSKPIALRRTDVPHRAYCTALHDGLQAWIDEEATTPGKEYPYVALASSALRALQGAVDVIRAFAQNQTVVAVLVTHEDLQRFTVLPPRKVVHLLHCRIGDGVPRSTKTKVGPRRYVEIDTDAGPLWVRPTLERTSDTKVIRIGGEVYRYLPRYNNPVRVHSSSDAARLDVTFGDDDLPPRDRQKLVDAARRFHDVADKLGFGRKVRIFLAEEFRIAVNWVRALFARPQVRNPNIVEVVRAGRIDIVELAIAVGGSRSVLLEDEPHERETMTVSTTPDVRALIADLAAEAQQEAADSMQVFFDVSDGGRASDAEFEIYSSVISRMHELSQQLAGEIAAFLEACALIPNAPAWVEEQTAALAAVYADRLKGWDDDAYMAQIRRRLGKAAPISMMQRRIDVVAERTPPADPADPERALILAAREAAELRRTALLAPPPLNESIDVSVSLILVCAATLDRMLGKPPGT